MCAVLPEATDHSDPRPFLALVETKREILLVVSQANVERRLVLLDQLVLEKQRFLDAARSIRAGI